MRLPKTLRQGRILGKKYVCVGGHVIAWDGDLHYVRPERLAELYRVPKHQCILINNSQEIHNWSALVDYYKESGLTMLYPDESGKYKIS